MTGIGAVVLAGLVSAAFPGEQAPGSVPDRPAAPKLVRAAGMPLQDGALPPGSLTVRLVQGEFTGDLKGVTVEIELDGLEKRQALTGEMGRAEFAHLPVGALVRVVATVGGERLQSDAFPMPAESGVRLLLIAGAGGAAPMQASSPIPQTPSSGDQTEGALIRITMVSLTALAFLLVGAQQWRRRRRR